MQTKNQDFKNFEKLISVENISFSWNNGQKTLENITFEIFSNDFLTILGPNGCGKSSLIHLILGNVDPSNGSIYFPSKSNNANKNYKERFKIGYVDQEITLFPWLSVKKNILFGLLLKGISKKDQEDKIIEISDIFKIGSYINKFPHELSIGMKQKAVIARALVEQPDLLIMDEPFGSLDPKSRFEMHDVLKRISNLKDISVLFVTHNIQEAFDLSERIILMNGGYGKPGTIFKEYYIPEDIEDAKQSVLSLFGLKHPNYKTED
jgi:NitT/TauT family transport system ATP-binding protein